MKPHIEPTWTQATADVIAILAGQRPPVIVTEKPKAVKRGR